MQFGTIRPPMESEPRLRCFDYFLVGFFCAVLFGYAAFSGRPLTMHEARLPETSREMLRSHEWLLPTSGGRPWLERPPLPHWVVTTAMRLFGHDDRVWVVRLPSGLMGLIAVLLTMWMAGRVFGRTIGLITGVVLATSFEFYSYACLAEDDIYLGALVAIAAALFCASGLETVPAEADTPGGKLYRWHDLFSLRRPAIVGFFFMLGLTNLTKGPLLGLVILGTPVGVFLIWQSIVSKSLQPMLRFTWLWGWLITIAMTIAWPLWAYHRYPDVVDNWKYDYLGRVSGTYSDINEAWYYYLPTIGTSLLPWTPACLIGVFASIGRLRNHPGPKAGDRPANQDVSPSDPRPCGQGYQRSLLRFVLCWAIVPLLVLSIPKGKHHHYLVPLIAPWAILGAIGLHEIGKYLYGHGRAVLIVFAGLLLIGYSAGQTLVAGKTDHTLDDTAFLLRVHGEVPANIPLFINGKLGPAGNLDFFRCQFYSAEDAHLLHNLSYLRDVRIQEPIVYVICRAGDEKELRLLGKPVLVDQSPHSHDTPARQRESVWRFTLFRLAFDPNLKRYPLPPKITSLQAMERADGPWCGPRF